MSSERPKNTTGSGSEVGGVSAQEGLNVTSPSQQKDVTSSPSGLKAKAKARDNAKEDIHQEQDDDDDDDDDDEDMPSDEEDDDEEEDQFEEIDPSAIKPRRTRGIRVDYTSKEALAKAGLEQGADEDDDDDMKE